MQVAFGVLGWTPQVFWNSTLTEFYAAYDGWMDANMPPEKGPEGPTKEDNERLKARYGAVSRSVRGERP